MFKVALLHANVAGPPNKH